jgi:hypothetical protein
MRAGKLVRATMAYPLDDGLEILSNRLWGNTATEFTGSGATLNEGWVALSSTAQV